MAISTQKGDEHMLVDNCVAGDLPLSVSMYSSREDPATVLRALRSIGRALESLNGTVDVIVNGEIGLAHALAGAMGTIEQPYSVWFLPLADKAHAWNQFMSCIARPASAYVFVDGYVELETPAIRSLVEGLAVDPKKLAATGAPLSGRSAARIARQMKSTGGLHGNLFAISASFAAELRRIGFRIPLGVYRGDSLLCAVASLGGNLQPRKWEPSERIAFVDEARWSHRSLRWWRLPDLKAQFRRWQRQQQGLMEDAAFSARLDRDGLPFEALPSTVEQLVVEWAKDFPLESRALFARSPGAKRAFARLQAGRDWALASVPPRLVATSLVAPSVVNVGR
ncbi:MAG: hypothetical protein JNM33_08370 [Rubrivivax sp.]|nr:hypothetical protein [Rubrivivax sp.]